MVRDTDYTSEKRLKNPTKGQVPNSLAPRRGGDPFDTASDSLPTKRGVKLFDRPLYPPPVDQSSPGLTTCDYRADFPEYWQRR